MAYLYDDKMKKNGMGGVEDVYAWVKMTNAYKTVMGKLK
jgi:hypothetical protein